jgi:hypothetical protein
VGISLPQLICYPDLAARNNAVMLLVTGADFRLQVPVVSFCFR